jgi:hypothetical protein
MKQKYSDKEVKMHENKSPLKTDVKDWLLAIAGLLASIGTLLGGIAALIAAVK